MCTLTYLPIAKGYLFTSSRDESTARARAVFPVYQKTGNATILMPKDPAGGGSWIATDDQGNTACLLNGAMERHQQQLPYRKSRGLVLLDTFRFAEISDFAEIYDFEGIEPFTLIHFSRKQQPVLSQMQWDAKKVHYQQLPVGKPQIWSSVMLYDQAMRQKRAAWFRQWLAEKHDFTAEAIRHFHLYGGENDVAVNFKMKRKGGLQTISLSCIEVRLEVTRFFYHDFVLDKMVEENFTHSVQ